LAGSTCSSTTPGSRSRSRYFVDGGIVRHAEAL
jgi:hypothetical protein